MSLLKLADIRAEYRRDQAVLNGVNLELARGDFLGLIGPNGCGKSTLIRTVTGILPLRSGAVYFNEKDICLLSRQALACHMAVVPQEAAREFAFTVREIVAMGRHPYIGRFHSFGKEDKAMVERAMGLTHIVELAERNIQELSGGERQRVIIARALAQAPDLLLLDEPTNHLDINHQVEVFDLLHQLNQEQGMTILCVTHDLNFAGEYCAQLALMDKGKVVASGSPVEVLTSELIGDIYGVEVNIEQGHTGSGPRVIPVSRIQKKRTMLKETVT